MEAVPSLVSCALSFLVSWANVGESDIVVFILAELMRPGLGVCNLGKFCRGFVEVENFSGLLVFDIASQGRMVHKWICRGLAMVVLDRQALVCKARLALGQVHVLMFSFCILKNLLYSGFKLPICLAKLTSV